MAEHVVKTAHEALVTHYHQAVTAGTPKSDGASSFLEAEVVGLPCYHDPMGENETGHSKEETIHNKDVASEEGGAIAHMEFHLPHMGHKGEIHAHTFKVSQHDGPQGGHEGYRSSEEGHPHKVRGDHERHGSHHK